MSLAQTGCWYLDSAYGDELRFSKKLPLLKAAGDAARRHFKVGPTNTHNSLSSYHWRRAKKANLHSRTYFGPSPPSYCRITP